ncbi:hypothetical protein SAMD00019534_025190 [Acytostelium subglobosum LB1]|uniref:hypothetical protein n=1 Tax=Acytostelium subglobosum LB1 TaxID=1410327 RepID=UPI000644D6E0|nr:hypothetical protein SAMD00019534_025190 [Acytostelium subglobosum LB1]GAM19344.1 hypothetical protein SAMD00019534_025190 [Acytostelium subglobosum LB1]|eukprot:XP_012757271.1 hypothetical protein SAMD00019534_025190 [Acytostelium subglobosum LB1]
MNLIVPKRINIARGFIPSTTSSIIFTNNNNNNNNISTQPFTAHFTTFRTKTNNYNNNNNDNNKENKNFTFGSNANKTRLVSIVSLSAAVAAGSGSALMCQEKTQVLQQELPRSRTLTEEEYNELKSNKRQNALASFAGATALSGFAGYCAGYASRRLGRIVMYVLGVLFIIAQTLSYYEYIAIDWGRVWRDASPKFTKEKQKDFLRRFLNLLTMNIPFKVGFASGFYIGFKSKA